MLDGMLRVGCSGDVSHRRSQAPTLAARQTSPIGWEPKANRKLQYHGCSTVWCDWAARETPPIQPRSAQARLSSQLRPAQPIGGES